MDYSTNGVFMSLQSLTIILILYDIMCQYSINLLRRFSLSPYLRMPSGLTILGGIGQFHVHGHRTQCFPRYSVNFIEGAGVQGGETMEPLWPKAVNEIAGSTRGMSNSHRREVLDDHMNDSNWQKTVRLGK